MFPPIFQVAAADPGVTAILGAGPVRLYPFGSAPEGVTLPYVVWQLVAGSPENYLNQRPDLDGYTLQVDCWAISPTEARNVAKALRDAIEPHAYITRWGGEIRDNETGSYRVSFDCDWLVPR